MEIIRVTDVTEHNPGTRVGGPGGGLGVGLGQWGFGRGMQGPGLPWKQRFTGQMPEHAL
jgi:hypothetical protein